MDIAIHRRLDTGVAKQLLQNLRLHPAFNHACRIGMAECVHTEPFNSGLIAQLIQVGIIGAVFVGHTGSEVNKDQIPHNKLLLDTCPPIHVFQGLGKHWRFFSVSPAEFYALKDLVRTIG